MTIVALTTPGPFGRYPFAVVRDTETGEARLDRPVAEQFHERHPGLDASRVYVDPVNGSDANSGAEGSPLRTLTAAMASTAGTVVLAAGVYATSNDYVALRDKVILTEGPVIIRAPGTDLSAAVWTDAGNGVASTAITGTLHRLVDHDAAGGAVGLRQFTSLSALNAATEGWAVVAGVLYVKQADQAPGDPDFGADLEGLYSGRIRTGGASLLLDGEIELRGITAEAYARNGHAAEIWATGDVSSSYAPGHGFYAQGGWLVLQGVDIRSPLNDGINANPEGDIRSLIVDDNVTVEWTGDRRTFVDGSVPNRQHSSAHGGADHISVGGTARNLFGQGIADTSIAGVLNFSWIVDFDSGSTQGHLEPFRTGVTMQGFGRFGWIDGVAADASAVDGLLVVDASHAIHAGVDGWVRTLLSGIAYAAASAPAVNVQLGTAGADAFNGLDGIMNLMDGGAGADSLVGGNGRDLLVGGAGDDTLRGGAGADVLDGGAGIDTAVYYLNTPTVTAGVTLNASGLTGGASITMGDGMGNFDLLIGIERIVVTGSAYSDTLMGGSGDDILNGGGSSDILIGGAGNDQYVVGSSGDVVVEGAGQGTADRVMATVNYVLGADVHVEILSTFNNAGTEALHLYGNELANIIYGNDGANTLRGMDGADNLWGYGGDDRLEGGNGDDVLTGGLGNDVLVGGAGADQMRGGVGDDSYYVDNALDEITELTGEGADRIYASVSYTLRPGVHVEILSTDWNAGTTAINLTGSEIANLIYGNEGANTLKGMEGADNLWGYGGDDLLDGGSGDDVLTGGVGNDVLVGGLGADTMRGGVGDDQYYVDNASDVIVELGGEGAADRVLASVSYVLAAGADIEILSTDWNAGTAAIDLTGNGIANTVYGNEGANSLSGLGGDDVLRGNGGDDILVGGDGADSLIGGTGDDLLAGGAGADALNGGDGIDTAVFTGTASEYVVQTLPDGRVTISDSVTGRDGLDTLTAMEWLQFSDQRVWIGAGSPPAAPVAQAMSVAVADWDQAGAVAPLTAPSTPSGFDDWVF